MIVKPSIAFSDFAGSAKDVTARNVKGRNILSSKAQHSKVVTPAQAVSRNRPFVHLDRGEFLVCSGDFR